MVSLPKLCFRKIVSLTDKLHPHLPLTCKIKLNLLYSDEKQSDWVQRGSEAVAQLPAPQVLSEVWPKVKPGPQVNPINISSKPLSFGTTQAKTGFHQKEELRRNVVATTRMK